jgi:hypothetical protein
MRFESASMRSTRAILATVVAIIRANYACLFEIMKCLSTVARFSQIRICPKFAIKFQAPGGRLPILDATMSNDERMETFLVATLRAHFRSNGGSLIKRLHMPDDRRVLDG